MFDSGVQPQVARLHLDEQLDFLDKSVDFAIDPFDMQNRHRILAGRESL
jgi:hypothetical protein